MNDDPFAWKFTIWKQEKEESQHSSFPHDLKKLFQLLQSICESGN